MTLTPKNWKSFQHYTDRKPSWIKLHRSLLDDFEFSRLPVASRALAPLLWLLASEYEDGIIPCDEEELAFRFRLSLKELRVALSPLIECGFFGIDSNSLAGCKQDASLEKERETEKEKNICAVSNLSFEAFKRAYPKRKGSQGWPSAQKHFESAVKSGCDPSTIIEAAKKFATSVESAVGTEFVPMAETWMRKKSWLEFIPTPEEVEKARKTEEFLASRGYGKSDWPPQ